MDPAMVRFNGPPGEREVKTTARSIGASLLERAEQCVDVPARETAALILDLEQYPVAAGAGPQGDGGSRPGELKSVLQHVHHRCRKDLTSCPLRFHQARNYLIAYAPDESPLWVIAVLHGHRSPRVMAAILRGREE